MKYLLTLLLCITSSFATAQTAPWPSQSIRLIVSQSAGGSIDIAARLIGQKLSDALGKPVVIDNRAGANGMIAAEAVMRATDGHTFLMTSPSALTINQHVYKKVPYETLKDFVPVTQTTSIAFLLVVPANAPHKTAAELVAAAKANPGAIKFASAGIGNQSQLAAELLAHLRQDGVWATGAVRPRFVTHLDVDAAGIDQALASVRRFAAIHTAALSASA